MSRSATVAKVSGKAPAHPETGKPCEWVAKYKVDGVLHDSATFHTKKECEDWLSLLYNIEATNGTV